MEGDLCYKDVKGINMRHNLNLMSFLLRKNYPKGQSNMIKTQKSLSPTLRIQPYVLYPTKIITLGYKVVKLLRIPRHKN